MVSPTTSASPSFVPVSHCHASHHYSVLLPQPHAMCDLTDEDFLAALDSDPWLMKVASQPPPDQSQLPKSTSQHSLFNSSQQLPAAPPLSISKVFAARKRRADFNTNIHTALTDWRPTLTDMFTEEPPPAPPTPSTETDRSPTSLLTSELDALKHNNIPRPPSRLGTNARDELKDSFAEQRIARRERIRLQRENSGAGPPSTGPPSTPTRLGSRTEGGAYNFDRFQAEAIEAALKGQSFFLTGSAGTGKSFVLKAMIDKLRKTGKTVGVCASTGCAAVGIQGCTIHSFAGVGLGMDPIEVLRRRGEMDPKLRERFQTLHTLVIDEISMIDTFLFDKIEALIRAAREPHVLTPKGRRRREPWERKRARSGSFVGSGALWKEAPFGGLQVIVCGDFLQLPPVAPSDYSYLRSPDKFFAFDSSAWKQSIKQTYMLRTVHRQADRKFVGLLNEVRLGVVSPYTGHVLNACRISAHERHAEAHEDGSMVHFTKLFAFKRQVAAENSSQMIKLKVKGIRYVARDSIDQSSLGTITLPIARQMLQNVNAPYSVEMRKGCRVLCIKNLAFERGVVNGSAGEVVGFSLGLLSIFHKRKENDAGLKPHMVTRFDLNEGKDVKELDDPMIVKALEGSGAIQDENGFVVQGFGLGAVSPVVRLDNGLLVLMDAQVWEVYGMQGQVIASREQIPLILGWALSIHKAQGMTLGDVETDVGQCFDYGQVYVALSRATSVHRLRLRSFDASKVITHGKVVEFYSELDKLYRHKSA